MVRGVVFRALYVCLTVPVWAVLSQARTGFDDAFAMVEFQSMLDAVSMKRPIWRARVFGGLNASTPETPCWHRRRSTQSRRIHVGAYAY